MKDRKLRILALGMNCMMRSEIAYEARAIHHIAKMGHEVDYWTDNPLDYSMEPVLRQPPTLRNFVFHEGNKALASTPRRFHPLDLRKIIDRHRGEDYGLSRYYDVIYSAATTGIDMGVFLRDMLDIKLVVQWLDVPYWRIEEWGPYEIYKHSVMPLPLLPTSLFDGYRSEWAYWFGQLPNIDLVSTILEVTKGQIQEYAKKFGVANVPPISVTHHGSIDKDTMDHIIATEKVEKKNQVIIVNRIDFHKGVDQSVLVCKLIQDMMPDNPPSFVFVSTGNQQWYEDNIKAAAHGSLKDVTFTGWVDNPTKFRLIRESKVLLDNETPEGFGGCVLSEAIYCDTVPLCWDRASKREVNPTGAIHIPLDDYQAMAEMAVKILRAPEQPDLTEAKKFVASNRSIESHARGLVQAMDMVVK